MKNIILTFSFVIAFIASFAQDVPKVPAKMKFADIQLTIDADAQAEIQKKVNSLMQNRTYYNQFLERCNLYFPLIEKVFKEEKLPEDFKFLAIQESTLNPDAVSRSNAVGFWQFKDFTARELGLRVDPQVDERKSIVASSRAAAKYLKKNNYFLKNWIYATLSYNLGLTGANQLLDRKYIGAKKLTLDKNTHNYIIHFLANRLAFKSNLGKTAKPSITLFEYSSGAKGKTLDDLAKITTLSKDELKSYNRWLQIGYIPPDKEYSFVLPVPNKRKNELVAKLNLGKPDVLIASAGGLTTNTNVKKDTTSKTESEDYPKFTKRETKKIGDQTFSFVTANGIPAVVAGPSQNIDLIANTLKIPKKRFLKYNDLTLVDALKEGNVYYLRNKKGKAKTAIHVTQPKQTIWEVAQIYGIKLKKLLRKNRLAPNPELKPGRVLFLQKKRKKTVPIEYRDIKTETQDDKTDDGSNNTDDNNAVSDTTTTTNTDDDTTKTDDEDDFVFNPNAKFHQVRKGEGLFAIARLYQITVADLIKWNDLGDNLELSLGQILQVKENVSDNGSSASNDNNTGGSDDDNAFDLDTDIPNIDEDGNITNVKENNTNTGGVDSTGGTGKSENLQPTNVFHVVEKGETLYRIARKYNATVQQVRYWNGFNDDAVLSLGARLIVGKKYPVFETDNTGSDVDNTISDKTESDNVTDNTSSTNNNDIVNNTNNNSTVRKKHIIAKGEGLWSISRKYKVSVADINKWNNLSKNAVLKIGQELYVEAPVANSNNVTVLDANVGITNIGGNVVDNTSNNNATESATPLIHKVTRNDNIYEIAKKYNVDVEDIRRWNGVPPGVPLAVGQELVVSGKTIIDNSNTASNNTASNNTNDIDTNDNISENTGSNAIIDANNTNNVNTASQVKYHTVQKGEGLWGIGRKYGVSAKQIQAWNNISGSLKVGQKLIVSKEGKTNTGNINNNSNTSTTKPSKKYHTVKKGEGLWSITRKYGVSKRQIIVWNNLKSEALKVGQKLIVGDASNKTVFADNKGGKNEVYHTIKKGEGLWGIAKKYGVKVDDIRRLNNIKGNNIKPGQKIRVK